MQKTRESRKLLTTGEVAAMLGISIPTVRALVARQELTAAQRGYWLRFERADVEDYQRRAARPATAA